MTTAVLPRYQQVLAGLGLATRTLPPPLPAALPVRALALVDEQHADESNALRSEPTPTRAVVAGPDPEETQTLALEAAFALRLSTPTEPAFTGVAEDEETAVHRSLLSALEACGPLPLPHQPYDAAGLLGTDRRITFFLARFSETLVLMRAEVPGEATHRTASGWGSTPEQAATRALSRLLTGQDDPAPHTQPLKPDERTSSALARALKQHGRTAHWRCLEPVDGLVVAQTRLNPPLPSADRPPRPAPHQMNLAVPAERVRLSRLYHQNSKLQETFRDLPPVDLANVTPGLQAVVARPARALPPGTPEVLLARRERNPRYKSLDLTLRSRRSWAPMSSEPLPVEDLGRLLDSAVGVTGTAGLPGSPVRMPLRAVPASGGLFSTDLYVYARRIEGLPSGLHYYEPIRHSLHHVRPDCDDEEVLRSIGYPARAGQAAAVLVYVASLRRLQWKYWERAYRMAHLDCGHMAQNVILVATAMDLVAHPMIAFVDDYFDRLTGANGQDEATVHLTLLGPARATDPRPEE